MTRHPNSDNLQDMISRSEMSHNESGAFGLFNDPHLLNFGVLIFGFIITLILAFVIATDAAKRGRSGIFWGFATLVAPLLTIPIYLILIVSSSASVRSQSEMNYLMTKRQSIDTRNIDENEFTSYSLAVQTYPETNDEKSEVTEINDITKSNSQYCTSCGTKNTLSSIYCNKCGNKVVS